MSDISIPSPPGSAHMALSLAGLCAVGGAIGLSRGSKASAMAGSILAAAFGASAYTIQEGHVVQGYSAAMYTSSLLSGAMFFRFVKTRKVMPAGALAAVGAGAVAYYSLKLDEMR